MWMDREQHWKKYDVAEQVIYFHSLMFVWKTIGKTVLCTKWMLRTPVEINDFHR